MIVLLLCAWTVWADDVTGLWKRRLIERIEGYARQMDGVLGVAFVDLKTGEEWSLNGDVLFPQASAIKVPILVEVFRQREAGQLRFADEAVIEAGEVVGGSGVLQKRGQGGPLRVRVEEAVREMIASSDNTATNWCIRRVGMERVNRTMAEMGFPRTRLQRVMIDQAAATRDEENISTPEEMLRLVKRIGEGKVVSEKASAEMIGMMKLVDADFRTVIPKQVAVASKVGELTGVRTEVGIVYLRNRPFALAVMGTFLKEPFNPVPEVTRMVYEYFDRLDRGNRYGNLGVR
jgi:beta-lactamase class A